MLCNYNNPVMQQKAKQARADAYNNAISEDDCLAAAESQWQDYIPVCFCPECSQEKRHEK